MTPLKKVHAFVLFIAVCLISLFGYLSLLSQSAEDASQPAIIQSIEPTIGLETILTVPDVERVLMNSAENNDFNQLEEWQSQIIVVAKEAGYRDQDLEFLTGQNGLDYLKFRGVRLLFQRDVKQAYRRGENLDVIFKQYPQASDLFEQTEQLFIQRDDIIQSLAQTLIDASISQPEGGLSMDEAQRAAMQIWRERNDVSTPSQG